MPRWHVTSILAVAAECLWATLCAAQTPPSTTIDGLATAYIQAGPAVTTHFAGDQYHRARPALTGTTLGGAAIVGARIAEGAAVEAEVMVDRTLSGAITHSYFSTITYTAESRDVVLGVNLRLRPLQRVPIEVTAGGGWAATRFARRDVVEARTFPPGVTSYPDRETTVWEPSAGGSIAMAVRLSPRVELVPSLGVRWIRRQFDTEAWYFGVGRWTVVAGGAVRLRR